METNSVFMFIDCGVGWGARIVNFVKSSNDEMLKRMMEVANDGDKSKIALFMALE